MGKTKGQINFNSFVSFIILGVVTWVGVSIQQHSSKLAEISQDVAVLKNTVSTQGAEVSAIKQEQTAQTVTIGQIQIDLARIRKSPVVAPPKQTP